MVRIEDLETRLRELRQLTRFALRKEPGWDLKVMSGVVKILYPGKHSIRRFLDDRIDDAAAELHAAREAEDLAHELARKPGEPRRERRR